MSTEIVAADPTTFTDPCDVFDLAWHLNAWASVELALRNSRR